MARTGRSFPIQPHTNYAGKGSIFYRSLNQSISDTISLTESFLKQPSKTFTESLLSISEAFTKTTGKVLSEAFSVVESFLKNKNTGIAIDATGAASTSTGASANTWTHTCSGTNRLLIVVVVGPPDSGGYSGVAVTYNGVSMTEIGHTAVDNSTGDWYVSMWYLLNPASGANTVSFTGSNNLAGCSMSYKGVSQTGFPDGSAVSNSPSSVSSKTVTNTVTASNCWQVLGTRNMAQTNWTAGTGTTARVSSNSTYCQIWDSNGTVATGSQSLIINGTADKVGGIIASFAPAGNSYTQAVSDAITLTESFLKSTGKAVSETFSLVETFIKQASRTFAETFSISEAFSSARTKVASFSETLGINEAFSSLKVYLRVVTDTFSLTDTIATGRVFLRTWTDTFSLSDTLGKLVSKTLKDSLSIIESLLKKLNGTSTFGSKRIKPLLSSLNIFARTKPPSTPATKRTKP